MIKFSILIPVYNVEKYLPECLKSVDNQTFKDFEVILVDDGTKDNSNIICDNYKVLHKNVKVIHKNNEGLISARRVGIKYAEGEYVIFLDSDDFLEAIALEEINEIIKKSKADLIIFNSYTYDGIRKKIFFENVFQEGIINNKYEIYDKLLLTYTLNSLCIKSVKRKIIDLDRDYTDFYDCNYGEDLLQTIPLVKNAKIIYYLNKSLYNYRTISGMMHKYSNDYYWSYKKVIKNVANELKSEGILDFKEKCASQLLRAAYGAITQFKYSYCFDYKELDNIRFDEGFVSAYDCVISNRKFKNLSLKQLIVIFLLKNKHYRILNWLLKIKKMRGKL